VARKAARRQLRGRVGVGARAVACTDFSAAHLGGAQHDFWKQKQRFEFMSSNAA